MCNCQGKHHDRCAGRWSTSSPLLTVPRQASSDLAAENAALKQRVLELEARLYRLTEDGAA